MCSHLLWRPLSGNYDLRLRVDTATVSVDSINKPVLLGYDTCHVSVWPLPSQVMQHMSKCFQAIGKLKLDSDAPASGQRPRGLGMVSCVGEEYVPFKSPLPLEGKVRHALHEAA